MTDAQNLIYNEFQSLNYSAGGLYTALGFKEETEKHHNLFQL